MSFDFECWTMQYTSHSPQPMQFSCFAIILFTIVKPHNFLFWRGQVSMRMCSSTSLVHKTLLVVADWLPQVMIILRVFTAIFTTFCLELAHINGIYSI